MPLSAEHVVRIAQRDAAARTGLGTGTLLAPHRILTARHVVCDAQGEPRRGLEVRSARSATYVPAAVEWRGEGDLDVAVLTADLDGANLGHPLALLSMREIGADESWEAAGYPAVRAGEGDASTSLEIAGGKARSSAIKKGELLLDAPVGPDVWSGLSGAAVVIGADVVGIVCSKQNGWEGKRLSATPVALFLHDEGFRRALGLDEADRQVNERVARILAGVTELLGRHAGIASFLAAKLALKLPPDDEARTVAHALVHERSAGEVARWLNHLDAELAKRDGPLDPRRAVRSLLFQLLPFALDWRPLLVRQWSAAPGGPSFVDLPVRTRTVAEIILAGIDDRWCKFAPLHDQGTPVGAALVELPAAKLAALIDPDGTKLGQLLVQQLAAQLCVDPSFRAHADLRDAVRGKLSYFAEEAPPEDRIVYYVVLLDADLPARPQVTRTVGTELPLLRFVGLGGGSVERETVLATHIVEILRRKL